MQDHYKSAQIHTCIGITNQFYLVSYSVTCVAGSLRHNHYHNYCNNKIIVQCYSLPLGVMAMVLNDIKELSLIIIVKNNCHYT